MAPPTSASYSSAMEKTQMQTCSLSEAMRLAVFDPAVDGEEIGVTFWGTDLHIGREPRVFEKQREWLLVQLYQDELSEGLGAVHCEFRRLITQ